MNLKSLKLINIDGKVLESIDASNLKTNGLDVNALEAGAYLLNPSCGQSVAQTLVCPVRQPY